MQQMHVKMLTVGEQISLTGFGMPASERFMQNAAALQPSSAAQQGLMQQGG